ncbi:MAG: hypothetical protein M0R47_21135 [Methylobacter sp.]|uniref:hypothetical protein n=1 Tax=Methylobacter sp. TaxID=2051955 RepID=UPI0025F95C52|nr:hypothetical protein [Methylobacter sp.]MCK9623028.1 hypothetical protein [Methylobacter sp.]
MSDGQAVLNIGFYHEELVRICTIQTKKLADIELVLLSARDRGRDNDSQVLDAVYDIFYKT